MTTYQYPSVLSIAGFDGSGGAGIQADIKTISALGCYATTVLTALPVQNTQGVRNIYPLPVAAIEEQMHAILDDIFPNAIKIGMIHTSELVHTVATTLQAYPKTPVVFDPVMVATSGHRLIEENTITNLTEILFPLAELITPNMDEAAILAGMPVNTLADMHLAGEKILQLGCSAVLVKGGHLEGSIITSLLYESNGNKEAFEFEKINTRNTHGSGCTLSSAIASHLALGYSLRDSVALGQTYTQQAIAAGADVQTGKGNGPLNHFSDPQPLVKYKIK